MELRARPPLPNLLAAFGVFALVLPAASAGAEEPRDGSGPAIAVVYGLSAGDLLNVRAAASPLGRTSGRLHSGSGVVRFACEEVKGYEWCKVRALDDSTLAGWAPARYLRDPKPGEVTDRWKTAAGQSREPENLAESAELPEHDAPRHAVVATAEEAIAQAIPDVTEPLPPAMPGDETEGEAHSEIPIPTPAPRDEPVEIARAVPAPDVATADIAASQIETAGAEPVTNAEPLPDPDLSARLGAEPSASVEPEAEKVATSGTSESAVDDAYSLAFAARGAPLTGGIYSPASASAEEAARPVAEVAAMAAEGSPALQPSKPDAEKDGPAPADTAAAAGDPAPGVPVPTPRPGQPREPAPMVASANFDVSRTGAVVPGSGGPAWIAAVEGPSASDAAKPRYDAVADIPCARYLGQPMTSCRASVARGGPDSAEVTVSWPDGGSRTISFRAGRPEKSDSRGEFRFSREADLNMIRVGASERFEITDTLAFGG